MIVLNDYDMASAGMIDHYPNGELLIDIPARFVRQRGNQIVWYYRNDADLVALTIVAQHIQIDIDPEAVLVIAYMPYSRLDRVGGENQAFTLKYVCGLINDLNIKQVKVVEPHSDVCVALLDRCEPIWATSRMLSHVFAAIDFQARRDFLVFPDAGAAKRYADLARPYPNVLVAHKVRDFASGKIESLNLIVPPTVAPGAQALIIDDLCSYGGTFVRTANALALSFNRIHLMVAHAEPTITLGEVFQYLTSVHATDSMPHDDRRITKYPLRSLI